MMTRSPGLASSTALAIASRRSTRLSTSGALSRRRSARQSTTNLLNDAIGILGPRIVRRDDHDITQTARNRAHEWTLRSIAIAGTSKRVISRPVAKRPCGLEQVSERVVCMRVIHDDCDFVFGCRHELETAGDAFERLNSFFDRFDGHVKGSRQPRQRRECCRRSADPQATNARDTGPRGVRTSKIIPSSENESGPVVTSAGRLTA